MNFLFEIWIAYRYLRSRQEEGFISIVSLFSFLGITLGVATLIIVMSVMNGFREEMLSRILGLNGHASISISNDSLSIDLNKLSRLIINSDEVEYAVPTIQSTIMASSKYSSTGVRLKGLEISDISKRKILNDSFSERGLLEFAKKDRILLGDKLSKKLLLSIGDSVTLISPTGVDTPFGSAPNAKTFIVADTFNVGMYEYDSSVIFMKLDEVKILLGLNKNYMGMIEIFFKNPDEAEYNTDLINALINKETSYNLYAIPWTKKYEQFFSALKVERNVMFIILTLIIIVAAFNVISSMIMLVKDKENSISILRTIGISRLSIMRIFIMVGSFIGILGTVLGCIVGILFSLNIEKIQHLIEKLLGSNLFEAEIYFLSNLPSKIEYYEVFWVILFSLLLSFLATVYPAWRASSIDPAKVLRYG